MARKTEPNPREKRDIAYFQKHLKEYMELFNVTDTSLGEQLGVSRTQIYKIKTGRCQMTKAQYIAIMVILSGIELNVVERIFKSNIELFNKYYEEKKQ